MRKQRTPEKSIWIRCPAKINFRLRIHSKRPDGYHRITADFIPVSLFDEIQISPLENSGQIEFVCNSSQVNPQENTVVRAIRELENFFGIKFAMRVQLTKNIPVCAGFGGGSSNAGRMLRFLVDHFSLDISENELAKIALKIGADVPFFLNPSPGIFTDLGETKVANLQVDEMPVLLAKPYFSISTAAAYASISGYSPEKKFNEKISLEDWCNASPEINDFWQSELPHFAELSKIRESLLEKGVKNVLLTGSGSGLILIGAESFGEKIQKQEFRDIQFFPAKIYRQIHSMFSNSLSRSRL